MSAMTRGFAGPDHTATHDMARYYGRRAEAGVGLILTESVIVHPSGDGFNNVPHMATRAQAESWRPVLDAVQSADGVIACQLLHCGRISHSDYTGGTAPVSSTNRAAAGINRQNGKAYGTPVALTQEGILETYGYFVEAAKRALDVGFDAIELHLAHGYLADQFFDARVNDRTDAYGGNVEKRCRYGLELIKRVLEIAPSERLIVRVSPSRFMGQIYDWPDLEAMTEYFLPAMWRLGVRAVDISCANADYFQTSGRVIRMIRPYWSGLILGGASLQKDVAQAELDAGYVDLVTWGRFLLANPDFVARLRADRELSLYDPRMLSILY